MTEIGRKMIIIKLKIPTLLKSNCHRLRDNSFFASLSISQLHHNISHTITTACFSPNQLKMTNKFQHCHVTRAQSLHCKRHGYLSPYCHHPPSVPRYPKFCLSMPSTVIMSSCVNNIKFNTLACRRVVIIQARGSRLVVFEFEVFWRWG